MNPREQPHDPFLADEIQHQAESQLDLRQYVQQLRRHWRLIALLALVGLAAGTLHYVITPKEYRATTQVQIERRQMTAIANSEMPWLENWWNMEFYPTQYELLKSRGLAERVVQELDLVSDPAFNPGGLAALRSAAETGAGGPDADRAVLGRMAERLRAGLTVEPVKGTQLVRLSYHSSSPVLAARVANGFAQSYIDWGVESRTENVGLAGRFLDEQIEKLKAEIQEREAQLQAYGRSEDIVRLSPETDVTVQRLESLNQDYMAAMRERIARQSRYEELTSIPRETVAATHSGGLVDSIKQEQLQLERRYETQLKTYKPEWPQMEALKAEIDKGRQHLESVIQDEARKAIQTAYGEYQTVLRQEQKIASELERAKQEALDQGSATVLYNNLEVEIRTRRDTLNELLRQQSETQVAAELQGTRASNVWVVDAALVPGSPFRPSLPQDLGGGLMAGLLLGIGGAFLLEFLDRTVKSADQAERLLGVPVLATIPDLEDDGRGYGPAYAYASGRSKAPKPRRWLEKRKAADPVEIELLPHRKSRSAVAEAYRALRTALLMSTADELKVVAVTSASAGEGKTVTASNLAVVLAQLGKRVVLVDADLRKPRLHRVFQTSNAAGLVTQLTGGGSEGVMVKTEVPGLALIPSGPIPPNPSELLSSERMRELVQRLRQSFDFVILDTPPVLAVTDATLIGSFLADGTVLCLRAGHVLREDAVSCRERLHMAGVKVLGAVLNAYRPGHGRPGKDYGYYAAYAEADTTVDSAA